MRAGLERRVAVLEEIRARAPKPISIKQEAEAVDKFVLAREIAWLLFRVDNGDHDPELVAKAKEVCRILRRPYLKNKET